MVDQIKNNLNSLGSAGSNKVSSESKKSSNVRLKGLIILTLNKNMIVARFPNS